MATIPQSSLPQQCGSWADLKAAYRLLSNEAVDPPDLQQPHRRFTYQQCEDHPVVLCVQDDTDLNFTRRTKIKGLGKVGGGGNGRGVMQHTTLAVLPNGQLLGVLDQSWFNRVESSEGETRQESLARWRESCVWPDAVAHVGPSPEDTRFIHITDRAGDDLEMIHACRGQDVGFVVRARHNRRVQGGTDKLWSFMSKQPVQGTIKVKVSCRRNSRNRIVRPTHQAKVSIRFAHLQLEPPWNHPSSHKQPCRVWAVYICEKRPPKGADPIDWMLLTSELVTDIESAQRIIQWYQCRWVIEEWHRVLKEGCRLEASQLDNATDIQRLSAILSVISVRMLQLRDLAGFRDCQLSTDPSESGRPDDPQALQKSVPKMWLSVVGYLANIKVTQLTPRQFWLTIAKRGGWVGRKGDSRPGWKVIWRGWYDIHMMVQGAELYAESEYSTKICG